MRRIRMRIKWILNKEKIIIIDLYLSQSIIRVISDTKKVEKDKLYWLRLDV